jgi:hypothetical protein
MALHMDRQTHRRTLGLFIVDTMCPQLFYSSLEAILMINIA